MKYWISLAMLCLSCQTGQLEMESEAIKERWNSINSVAVSVEFILHEEQIIRYPLVAAAFSNALAEWACNIPIKPVIYIKTRDGLDYTQYKNGLIEVLLDDIQAPAYGESKYMVGLWQPHLNRVLLDADRLDNLPKEAFTVALHELGHVFGLPHVVNFNDYTLPGYLVLKEGQEARSYVMYPEVNNEFNQEILSSIEITFASRRVIFALMDLMKISGCGLTSEH